MELFQKWVGLFVVLSVQLHWSCAIVNPIDTTVLAPREHNSAAQVYVGFYVESLGNFKPTQMAFDVDLYLRLSWNDYRLRNHTGTEVPLEGKKALEKIWIPDIYFANAREARSQTVTVTNIGGTLFPDGTVALSRRVTLSVACNMELKDYPLDQQKCYIRLSSYANNSSKVNITWFSHAPVNYNPNINLPELEIISMQPKYCDSAFYYPITEQFITKSNFSCLNMQIYLRRSITYHLVQSYVPTALIVIISWVSFWIDPEAVPARVSLSFTTLLTLSTMGAGLRYSLPAVSYAKAIDYWYGMCMIFIFAALLEFAVVNSLMRRTKKCQAVATRLLEQKCIVEDCADAAEQYGVFDATKTASHLMELVPLAQTHSVNGQKTSTRNVLMASNFKDRAVIMQQRALRVDFGCRIVFPTLFALFNLAYWSWYLVFRDTQA